MGLLLRQHQHHPLEGRYIGFDRPDAMLQYADLLRDNVREIHLWL